MILGLDVSTSIVGWTFLNDDGSVHKMGHTDFKKCKTLWEKADHIQKELVHILALHGPVSRVYIEESLQSFRPGLSSAAVLMLLAKFNGLTSFFVRNIVGFDPQYIAATTARKICGMNIQKTKTCGKPGKLQAFEWCISGPLKTMSLPKGKTGAFKSFVYDEVDSYVIARAGFIQPVHLPKAKVKKKKK
jgi:hypothetical protein